MAPSRQRGVSGVTLRDFFIAVLQGLGAPVTQNNLDKLAAVARLEGHGGDYNPFNYVVGPGTNFNSVGVKNYPDVNTGVAQTVRLLRQGNTRAMRDNLMSNGSYQGWLSATSGFYRSWGGPNVTTSQSSASAYLNNVVDGPPARLNGGGGGGVQGWGGGGGGNVGDLTEVKRWMDSEEAAFNSYLGRLSPDEAKWITAEVRQDRNPQQVWQWLAGTSPEVRRYIDYVAKLPADQRQMAIWERINPGATGGGGDGGLGQVKSWMDIENEVFRNYLRRLQPAEQESLIGDLRWAHANGLAGWGQFFPKWTAPEVQRFVQQFLAQLPRDQQDLQLGQLGQQAPVLPPPPQRPTADPAMSAELQQLLGRFGVDYPNAPAPTPGLLAFLRGIGSSLSTAEDLKRRAEEQINQRAEAANADVNRSGERAKQGLTSSLISRGVLRSGEANTDYARQAEDLGVAHSNIERERVGGVTQADFAYQQSADTARQQALERTLGVEQQQQSDFGAAQAQYDAMLTQQRAADVAWERERKAMEESIRRQEELARRYASSGVVV